MSTCHCFCASWHPHNAQTASCTRAPDPGLTVLASGTLVGSVPVPVCRDCFDAHHYLPPGEQRGGPPHR